MTTLPPSGENVNPLSLLPGGSGMPPVASNVFYLVSHLVDKMWAGVFTRDPHQVFDFIIKLIQQVGRERFSWFVSFIYYWDVN